MTNSTFYKATFTGENHFSKQKIIVTTAFQTNTAQALKIEIPIIKFNISATYNTAGIINKLVTVFAFATASSTVPTGCCTRIPALLPIVLTGKVTYSYLRPSLHRDTAPVPIYKTPARGHLFTHSALLYRETRVSQRACTMTAKTRAMLRPFGCVAQSY